MMRVLTLCMALALAGCGGGRQDEEIEKAGAWDAFMSAMSDEMRGAPSAASLRETRRFDKAGVSFHHPALLRVRVDEDEYPSWSFGRGEFELELHAPDSAFSSADYLDALATAFDADEPSSAANELPLKVEWCGASIEAVVRHVKIFGDHHRYQGFDLPGGDDGSRFLIFSDMLVKGHWSTTAQATFDAVSDSIQCQVPVAAE